MFGIKYLTYYKFFYNKTKRTNQDERKRKSKMITINHKPITLIF